jgi:hypothetical protein
MSKSKDLETGRYPGWPSNQGWPPLREWERDIEPTEVPLGQGLLYSGIGPSKTDVCPPHPDYVKKWRSERAASVKRTADYLALTKVQVLETCR